MKHVCVTLCYIIQIPEYLFWSTNPSTYNLQRSRWCSRSQILSIEMRKWSQTSRSKLRSLTTKSMIDQHRHNEPTANHEEQHQHTSSTDLGTGEWRCRLSGKISQTRISKLEGWKRLMQFRLALGRVLWLCLIYFNNIFNFCFILGFYFNLYVFLDPVGRNSHNFWRPLCYCFGPIIYVFRVPWRDPSVRCVIGVEWTSIE